MSRLILRLSLIVALLGIAGAFAAPGTVGAQEEGEETQNNYRRPIWWTAWRQRS